MRVGFIGTGNMGRILIEGFIQAKALRPQQIYASNRTFAKVMELAKKHTGLHAYSSNVRVVQEADLIFLCIKPLEFKAVIQEIAADVHQDQLIISITSPVTIKDLESQLKGKIAKVIPSITNAVGQGASLIMAGERLKSREKETIYSLMKTISHPFWIDEKYTRIASDLVSCGPAFISCLLEMMADAAHDKTGLPKEQAVQLITYMLSGLAALLDSHTFNFKSLQEKVSVPGGVTAVGLDVIKEEAGSLFHHLFKATHLKYDEDLNKVFHMFYG